MVRPAGRPEVRAPDAADRLHTQAGQTGRLAQPVSVPRTERELQEAHGTGVHGGRVGKGVGRKLPPDAGGSAFSLLLHPYAFTTQRIGLASRPLSPDWR